MTVGINQRDDECTYNRTIIIDMSELYAISVKFIAEVCNTYQIQIEDVIPFVDVTMPGENIHTYTRQLKDLTENMISTILLQLIIQEIAVSPNPLSDQYCEILIKIKNTLSFLFPTISDVHSLLYKLELNIASHLLSIVPVLDTYHLRVNSFEMKNNMLILSANIRETNRISI